MSSLMETGFSDHWKTSGVRLFYSISERVGSRCVVEELAVSTVTGSLEWDDQDIVSSYPFMDPLIHQSFSPDLNAVFVSRPNRFLMLARAVGASQSDLLEVHCSNPGRMRELLRPGAALILERSPGTGRRTNWTLAAARHRRCIVPLISARASAVAGSLVLPVAYTGAEFQSEKKLENSRIDWRIVGGGETWLEVKACSLVEEGRAMFPDAPSMRAVKHVGELVSAIGKGAGAEVVFMVMNPSAEVFSPNPHTDPTFTLALADAFRRGLRVRAVSVSTDRAGRSRVKNPDLPIDLSVETLALKDEGVLIQEIDGRFDVHRCSGDLEKQRRVKGGLVIRGPLRLFDSIEEELGRIGDEQEFIDWLLIYRHRKVFNSAKSMFKS